MAVEPVGEILSTNHGFRSRAAPPSLEFRIAVEGSGERGIAMIDSFATRRRPGVSPGARRVAAVAVLGLGAAAPGLGDPQEPAAPPPAWRVESIPAPEGVEDEIGGIAFAPDGALVVAIRRGLVFRVDPATFRWTLFASGLHEPLGLWVDADGSVVAADRLGRVRLRDNDGDGVGRRTALRARDTAPSCRESCTALSVGARVRSPQSQPAVVVLGVGPGT